MYQLHQLKTKAKANPLHLIIGVSILAYGLNLSANDNYFFFPPKSPILGLLNDDVVGFVGFLIGVGMIYWTFSQNRSVILNRWLIVTSTAFYTLTGMTELMHVLLAPGGIPHMTSSVILDLTMVAITLYVSYKSDAES